MYRVSACVALLLLVGAAHAAPQQQVLDPNTPITTYFPRPDHNEAASMARWLAHVTDYGTLATLSKQGLPISGSVSHSDGPVFTATGRIFFYLTPMDELTQNLKANAAASFTLSEAQTPMGCQNSDPEDPTCAKATYLGEVRPVQPAEEELARQAMFQRHPKMASWPKRHGFTLYELKVQEVHLLDYYGGMKYVKGADYYVATVQQINKLHTDA